MRIAFDVAGEGRSLPAVEGALRAASDLGHDIILIGAEAALRAELGSCRAPEEVKKKISILGEIQAPAMAAASLAAEGKAAAFVSAAPPSQLISAALWHMKRIKGVLRPALAAPFPTRKGAALLLDAGANVDCKPWHLLQFALMGAVYCRTIKDIPEPAVGLLCASGAGEGNGTAVIQEALPLLKYSKLKFLGALDAGTLPSGEADVVLTDGFLGEILLRLMAGVAAASFEMIESAPRGLLAGLGKLLAQDPARRALRDFRALEQEGWPLLGVDGSAVACRAATPDAAFNALRLAGVLAESGVKDEIRNRIEDVKSSLEFAKAIE